MMDSQFVLYYGLSDFRLNRIDFCIFCVYQWASYPNVIICLSKVIYITTHIQERTMWLCILMTYKKDIA